MGFNDFYIKKKIILGIIISLLLVSSSIVTINIIKNVKVNDIKTKLEKADFTITKFDIINITSGYVFINGTLKISNFTSNIQSNTNKVTRIKIEFFDKKSLGSSDIPLDNLNKPFENQINFTLHLPFSSNSSSFGSFFKKILVAENFSLKFNAQVFYTAFGKIDSFKFSNFVKFELQQKGLDLLINHIHIPYENGTGSYLNVSIYNPFKVKFALSGTSLLIIENYTLGILDINTYYLSQGNNDVIMPFHFSNKPVIVIENLFNLYNGSYQLKPNLIVKINSQQFPLNQTFTFSPKHHTKPLEVNVNQVSNVSYSISNLYFNFNLNITYNLPIEINITSLVMNVTTSKGIYIGKILWDSTIPLQLIPFESTVIPNLVGNFHLTATAYYDFIRSHTINIPNGYVTTKFFSNVIYLHFSISSIPIL